PAAGDAAGNIKPLVAKEGSIKVWAAATLAAFGSDADANAKIVIAALRDRTPAAQSARLAAVEAVPPPGAKGSAAVSDLIECLKERTAISRGEGGQLRERAARSLGRLGEHAKAAIPALSDMLKDSDRSARKAAAEALGSIGPEAVLAVPKLRDLAKNDPALADVAQAAL